MRVMVAQCVHVCQVRDRLFDFIEDPETLPIVAIAARVVFGVQTRDEQSRTYVPFPLGTRVRKDFGGTSYSGSVTEHHETLDNDEPKYYHVVYSDGE